jgi:glucose-6-phosphate 1-dehydrogenase
MSAKADCVVLFGATGDLAYKKLYPALHALQERGKLDIPIIGIAREGWSLKKLQDRIRASLTEAGVPDDDEAATTLLKCVRYVHGDYNDPMSFTHLAETMHDIRLPVFYLAIPPGLFGEVVAGLSHHDLTQNARVVVEKPLGRDLESAQELNRGLATELREDQIFRIDHFLGYEQVQNILVARFGNSMLEPIWNRRYVRRVHIEMSESFGVEGRGSFYETVGCLRDVVQNHLLQLVCMLAMEPPVSMDAQCISDEKVKVLRSIKPLLPENLVRGQFEGYRGEPGVDPESDVETYCALRFEIDTWRWAGVPFTIRAGKALGRTVTEAVVEYVLPPRQLFEEAHGMIEPNRMRFRMKPDDLIQLSMQVKQPGDQVLTETVDLSVQYGKQLGMPGPAAYERLMGDAIIGERRLFARGDLVEDAWRVVQPLLDDPPPVEPYFQGSMGPAGAARVLPPNLMEMLSEIQVTATR